VGRPPSIDRAEIESLYRKYGALVRRRARSILGDDHEAQDAMQEVFVRVIAAMAEFRGQSQPSTWLYRITTNLCLNRIRDSRRRRDRLAEAAEYGREPMVPPTTAPPPEARTALQAVLRRVSEDLAQVAVYYYVDDMDQAEIAAVLGVSRRTIGYRLDRFREQAQRILGETGLAANGPSGVPKAEGESG
jgi:RNA polymerase sigma-70 factor (ECF subfamily)